MKRIFILGVCALFIACNSSSEKASEATDSSTVATADTTAVVSATDTASTVAANPAETPAVTQPVATEAKAPEAAPSKTAAVKEATAPAKPAADADNGDVKKGEALIAKSDCFACHKVQEKVLGPSYKDVANKYDKTKANIDYLVNKIKTGGSGVWGAVPMSPHPALSDDDAKAMVQYILSLK